jgi:NhaP-type Na+/H+ or K+/H+ antiporter
LEEIAGALPLRQHWFSEPLLALLLGVAIGPLGLGWLDLAEHETKKILEQVARFSLAIVLVSVGLQLPHRYISRYWRSLTVLTFGGMALTWLASTLLLKWILALGLLPALLLGAVITPLDPVLAAGVTTGKIAERNLPERVRYMLSGCVNLFQLG